VIAFITYRFCRYLLLDRWSSTIAAVFFGFNKGFAFFFYFASTVATFLLILYGFGVLYYAIQSVRRGLIRDLVGYYGMLLLSVGTWEQWINWLAFLMPAAFVLAVAGDRSRRRRLVLHGIVMPLVIAVVYVSLRLPTIHKESSSVSEAQYLLSYPSIAMQVEDVVVNASLHIASIVEPVLFPWPMLSQSVIRNYNMDAFNPYNSVYTPFSTTHYRGFGDWYAGLIFGLFICATVVLIVTAYRQRQYAANVGIGLGLTYAGFVAHLPIMYRTYFVLPGYASLLDYKHPLSIMGFSLLVGWAASRVVGRLHDWRWQLAFTVAVCGWLVFCNYTKVAIAYRFQLGVFPW
jgi:hypothetical protein